MTQDSPIQTQDIPLPYRQRRPSRLPLLLSALALMFSMGSFTLLMFPEWVESLLHTLNPPSALSTRVESRQERITTRPPLTGNFSTLIADVSARLAPSVVNIDVKLKPRGDVFSEASVLDYFFGGGFPTPQKEQASQGSGVIYDAQKAYVLTNNHVIQGASQVQVTLQDGTQYLAKVIGSDPLTDLAVIQLQNVKTTLQSAPLSDSTQLRSGDWVIAMGSPLGFDHTVTLGIISAIARQVPGLNEEVPFIQTDAAINPGNSGGPLVNLYGEVVGINTAIAGNSQNIGFAIPANTIKSVATSLVEKGKVERPYVGVALHDLTPEIAEQLNVIPATKGVVVINVAPNSPAEKAGLQQGDIIQEVNGQSVQTAKDLQNQVRHAPMGSVFKLVVLRDKKRRTMSLKSVAMPMTAMQN
jgi:S1-C subfamily serine protease